MTEKKKSTRLAAIAVFLYVLVTVLCLGELFYNWEGGPMGGMANALKAAWHGKVGLAFTIFAFSAMLFARSGLRHLLISTGVLCVWLSVMGTIFNEDIRYAVNPSSFGSYGYGFSNKSDEWIGGEVCAKSGNGKVVFTSMLNLRPHKRYNGGVHSTARPPEELPKQVKITWWRGFQNERPTDPGHVTETTIAWPCNFDEDHTVVFNYIGDGRWTTPIVRR